MCSYTRKYADQLTLKQMHDQQISNQRRNHTVCFLCCFTVTIANNIKACAYLSSAMFWRHCHDVTSDVCHGSTISSADFSQETKPRPQKLANIVDRLTPALEVFREWRSAEMIDWLTYSFIGSRRASWASPYCRTVSVHPSVHLCVCPRQLESRVCTQHCASRATSTTGLYILY